VRPSQNASDLVIRLVVLGLELLVDAITLEMISNCMPLLCIPFMMGKVA
jgi:hypothetical protein